MTIKIHTLLNNHVPYLYVAINHCLLHTSSFFVLALIEALIEAQVEVPEAFTDDTKLIETFGIVVNVL